MVFCSLISYFFARFFATQRTKDPDIGYVSEKRTRLSLETISGGAIFFVFLHVPQRASTFIFYPLFHTRVSPQMAHGDVGRR